MVRSLALKGEYRDARVEIVQYIAGSVLTHRALRSVLEYMFGPFSSSLSPRGESPLFTLGGWKLRTALVFRPNYVEGLRGFSCESDAI